MGNDKETERRQRAESNIKINLAYLNVGKTVKEQAWTHWVEKRLNFNQEQALTEFETDNKAMIEKLTDDEYTRMCQLEKFEGEWQKKSMEIIFKILVPVDLENEPLELSHTWKDEYGNKSISVEQIMKEHFIGSAEPLAVTDPKTFSKRIIDKFGSGFEIEHSFGEKRKTVHFRLLPSHFPIDKV